MDTELAGAWPERSATSWRVASDRDRSQISFASGGSMKKISWVGCLCLTLVQPAFAQHEQHGRMAPKDIGTVSFETSCAPATKTKFNEAVALLHSFWFAESRALFEGVLKTD